MNDSLVWRDSDSGLLTLNDIPQPHWTKFVWSKDIPPSKSLVAWRLMHNKFPTDENLSSRGCHLPSICNMCCHNSKSTFHLFFDCPYAIQLWN
jgi:hypothetical protein